jgi:hypothetical protein
MLTRASRIKPCSLGPAFLMGSGNSNRFGTRDISRHTLNIFPHLPLKRTFFRLWLPNKTSFLTWMYSYPSNNCAAQFGLGALRDPQQEFPNYLHHDAGRRLIEPFLNSSAIAQSLGKPFMMFETNTASCGGFPGVSNSFGAALWAIDYGLIMATSNFSRALLHIGGQNVYYNVSIKLDRITRI